MKNFITALIMMLIVALPVHGKAATVTYSFSPSPLNVVGMGQTFDVTILGNFSEMFAGEELQNGSLDLTFDQTILNVNSVTLDASIPNDLGSATPSPNAFDINNTTGTVSTIEFGSLFGGTPDGPFTFATIEFVSVGFGTSQQVLTEDVDNGLYPFTSFIPGGSPPIGFPTVNTSPGSVTVSAIPVPSALLLMGTGLAALIGGRRWWTTKNS